MWRWNPFHSLNAFLLLTCFASKLVGGSIQNNTQIYFPVGVILDKGSWIGDVGWSCINLALVDFYEENPDYKTRLRLYFNDSQGTSLGAASAAMDLLQNMRVQAIIGPQSSTYARFVMATGNKAHVPVITFSAKSPSLLSGQAQYFIRTTMNDAIQAKAIASLVHYFNWRQVIPIFEDTEYGNGLIPFLVDELQMNEVAVPYRSSISLSATDEEICTELENLKAMQTRVFVVHMSHSIGFRLFSCAKKVGVMEKGYAWIVTYGLTDILNDKGQSAIALMKGVLGIKPYIHKTKKLTRFKQRWKEDFERKHPGTNATEPCAFGLWAYDTLQALAKAVQTTVSSSNGWEYEYKVNSTSNLTNPGQSPIGPKLLDSILHTNFHGLSGGFQLINGQLNVSTLEIVNFVENGDRRVACWVETHGISRHINYKNAMENIIWPGDTLTTPKGWEWPTNNKRLLIGIPVKPGYSEFVDMDRDPVTHRSTGKNFRGYCIEVFDSVIHKLPYDVPYDYTAFENSKGDSNGSYDDLVYQVYLKKFDAVVGDITIRANRYRHVDFTLPYTESGVIMVVPVKDYNSKSAWAFLEPMTGGLWLAFGCFFILTGFVVWALEHRFNDSFRGPIYQQIGIASYFSFSTLVFAHREKLENNLSKFVVIVWVFVVLILTSSYTASLTSMLTVQQLRPTVTDLNELIRSGQKVGYLNDSFVQGLLESMKFPASNLIAYSSPEEYDVALSNGDVAAIVDEIPYVKVFLSKFCGKYTMVGPMYKADGFGFAFPKNSPLVPDISRAILNLTQAKEFVQIESKLYKDKMCPDQKTDAGSSSLRLESFWGLFLITVVTSLLAVLFEYMHAFVCGGRRIMLFSKLYNQQEDSTHASTNCERTEQVGIMPVPNNDPANQSPSNLSNYTYLDTDDDGGRETPVEGEETPGRDITEFSSAPSLAKFLNASNRFDPSN